MVSISLASKKLVYEKFPIFSGGRGLCGIFQLPQEGKSSAPRIRPWRVHERGKRNYVETRFLPQTAVVSLTAFLGAYVSSAVITIQLRNFRIAAVSQNRPLLRSFNLLYQRRDGSCI